MDDASDELGELRTEIDRIDERIGTLLTERVDAVETVAEVKSRTGRNLVDEDREEAVKSRYEEVFRRSGLDAERGREFAAFLIELSLERETEIQGRS